MTVLKLAMSFPRIRVFRSLLALIAAGSWKCFSVLALDKAGLTKGLFGYDLINNIANIERPVFGEEGFPNSRSLILLLQMDAPKSLDQFNQKLA